MRKINISSGALTLLLLIAGLLMTVQPLLATSITYLYETGAVGELQPCG